MGYLIVSLAVLTPLALFASFVTAAVRRWRSPWKLLIVGVTWGLCVLLSIYVIGDLTTGLWFRVSPEQAEAEFEAVLGFDVPPVLAVVDADDLGWAPTDGPFYGYTAVFDPAGFDLVASAWDTLPDSSSLPLSVFWETPHDSMRLHLADTARSIEHSFTLLPRRHAVRYFHADE